MQAIYTNLPKKKREVAMAEELLKKRILVFDDEELVGDIVCRMLEHSGYDAQHVVSAADALQVYQEAMLASEGFLAVLADLNVPGGEGGVDLVDQLLRVDGNAQVFVTSGDGLEDAMRNPCDYGFTGAVKKPIDFGVIKQFISELEA